MRGLRGDALKDVVDKRFHDGHRLARDACVWVDLQGEHHSRYTLLADGDLLEYAEDLDGVGVETLVLASLLVTGLGDLAAGLLDLLLRCGSGHFAEKLLKSESRKQSKLQMKECK